MAHARNVGRILAAWSLAGLAHCGAKVPPAPATSSDAGTVPVAAATVAPSAPATPLTPSTPSTAAAPDSEGAPAADGYASAPAPDAEAAQADAAHGDNAPAPLAVRAVKSPLRLVQRWGREHVRGDSARLSADGHVAAVLSLDPPGFTFLDADAGTLLGQLALDLPGEAFANVAWALSPDGSALALVAPDRPGLVVARDGLAPRAKLPSGGAVTFVGTKTVLVLGETSIVAVTDDAPPVKKDLPELAGAVGFSRAADGLYVVWEKSVRALDPTTLAWAGAERSLVTPDIAFEACAVRGHFAVALKDQVMYVLDLRTGAVDKRAFVGDQTELSRDCDRWPTHDGRGALALTEFSPGGTEWFAIERLTDTKPVTVVGAEGTVRPVAMAWSADDARLAVVTARGTWVGAPNDAAKAEVESMVFEGRTIVSPDGATLVQARGQALRLIRLQPGTEARTLPLPRELGTASIGFTPDSRWVLVSGVKYLKTDPENRKAQLRYAWLDVTTGTLGPPQALAYKVNGVAGDTVRGVRGERNSWEVAHEVWLREGALGVAAQFEGKYAAQPDDSEAKPVFVPITPGGKVGTAVVLPDGAEMPTAWSAPTDPLACATGTDKLALPASEVRVALPTGSCAGFEWRLAAGSDAHWAFVLGRDSSRGELGLLVPLDPARANDTPPAPFRVGRGRVDGAFIRPGAAGGPALVTWGPDQVALWALAPSAP